jgi:hypothetical protein
VIFAEVVGSLMNVMVSQQNHGIGPINRDQRPYSGGRYLLRHFGTSGPWAASLWPLPLFGQTAQSGRMTIAAYTDDLTPEVCRKLLATHEIMHRAAFEVDPVDEEVHTGWSVLVRGPARDIPESDGEFAAPESWEQGEKSRWIAIRIDRVSGRHIVRPQG